MSIPIQTIGDKVKIDLQKQTIEVRSLSRLEDVFEVYMIKLGAQVSSLENLTEHGRPHGNVYLTPHTLNQQLISNGAAALHRMVLGKGWVIFGYNNIIDADTITNEITHTDGSVVTHVVLEPHKEVQYE